MPELLLEKPHGRDEALISPKMWKHIITQALYQLFWLFLIVYGAPRVLPAFSVRSPLGFCQGYGTGPLRHLDTHGIWGVGVRTEDASSGCMVFSVCSSSPGGCAPCCPAVTVRLGHHQVACLHHQ